MLEKLYYDARSLLPQYRSEPPGTSLDVNQLIRHQPAWRQPQSLRNRMAKTLIFNDWRLQLGRSITQQAIKTAMAELLQQGFVLYIPCKGSFIRVDNENTLKNHQSDFEPYHSEDLATAAVQALGLARDHIQVLDDYWVDYVLRRDESQTPRRLYASDFYHIQDRITKRTVLSQLRQAKPLLQTVVCDEFSTKAIDACVQLQRQCPELDVSVTYCKAIFHNDEVTQLLKKASLKEETPFAFTWNHLKQLNELTIMENSLPASSLDGLLQQTKQLKQLTLLNAVSLNTPLTLLAKDDLLQLKTLTLPHSKITIDNLKAFLVAAPNIEEICLYGCETLDASLTLAEDSLLKLKTLRLYYSNITIDNLKTLLAAAPNIEEICLDVCKALDASLTLAEDSLLKLKMLTLDYSNITIANLEALLTAAPNIENISLSECQTLDAPLALAKDSLLKLKKLSLDSSNITIANLRALLAAAPNLEEIDLSRCQTLDAPLTLTKDSLLKLKVLWLLGSNITIANLEALLAAAPNIEHIWLSSCQTLDAPLTLTKDSLLKLKKLVLNSGNITIANLKALLVAAPNLEYIDLSKCKTLDASLTLAEGSLPKLKVLWLSSSNITIANLKALLAAAPNLEYIDLSFTQCSLTLDKELQSRLARIPNVSGLKQSLPITQEPPMDSNRAPRIYPTQDPIHQPQHYKHHQPTPSNAPFIFHNLRGKNQGMVIERLSQYLLLQGTHQECISKLQDGICVPLSHAYLDNPGGFPGFLERASAWNGQQETLTDELSAELERLFGYVQRHQLHCTKRPVVHYLGDNLKNLLSTRQDPAVLRNPLRAIAVHLKNMFSTRPHPTILKNPWHAIAVYPVADAAGALHWRLYDPNFINGPQTIDTLDELMASIQKSLGNITMIDTSKSPPVHIKNPDAFLEEGGLIALCQCNNATAMLAALPTAHTYSQSALNGLLLRDINGCPAWFRALSSPLIKPKAEELLRQFHAHYPNAIAQLHLSIKALTSRQQQEAITRIIQYCPKASTTTDDLASSHPATETEATHNALTHHFLEQELKTWQRKAPDSTTCLEYSQICFKSGNQPIKRLIELDSPDAVQAMRLALLVQGKNRHRPMFFIHSPNDLVCARAYIVRGEDNTGHVHPGPGGALYDFLQTHRDEAPVLVVNYTTFAADDIARLNTLLDREPSIDRIPLPKKTVVIGLINTHDPNAYQGADFYSRFDEKDSCPLPLSTLKSAIPELPVNAYGEHDLAVDPFPLPLFFSSDWKEQLLGHWVLHGETLVYQEGLLMDALASNRPLLIQNGPWTDEAFLSFWNEAMVNGYVDHEGRRITLPKTLQLLRQEGYDWETLNRTLRIEELPDDTPHHLFTIQTWPELFHRYALRDNALWQQPGLIETATTTADKTLYLEVTHTPDDDVWAHVLHTCHALGVHLKVYAYPGVSLPHAPYTPKEKEPPHPFEGNLEANTLLVQSPDVSTTVESITQAPTDTEHPWLVLDVSECQGADVVTRLTPLDDSTEEGSRFRFKETQSDVLRALENHQNVVLTGRFSPELANELAPFLLERLRHHEAPGRLVLVSDDLSAFSYCPIQHHLITEKPALLTPTQQVTPLPALAPFDVLASERETKDWANARKEHVLAILQKAPYVLLAGLSGVGKTTFVTHELLNQQDTLFQGKANLIAWAKCDGAGRHYLFLDEANLGENQWSMFEGLFQKPPHLFLHGQLYPLTENHKVIFAANPLHYGAGRKAPPLFQHPERQALETTFEPMPLCAIYENIIKPIFADSTLLQHPDYQAMITHLLNVYAAIAAQATTDVLISPRELQMMALLIRHHPDASTHLLAITTHYAYTIASGLLPEGPGRQAFDARFKPIAETEGHDTTTLPLPAEETPFLITPSRRAAADYLSDILRLREHRYAAAALEHPAQIYGGLNGLVLEGGPGVGKSELVLAILRAHGYEEAHHITSPTSDKCFYRVPASLSFDEKKALLLHAFHQGAVVILDEINSSPMLEQLLNALLMGYTPEGERPEHPGFTLIGTQNPITMAGRCAASTASARRLLNLSLTEYTKEELITLLKARGLSKDDATHAATCYLDARQHAMQHHLTPAPTLRDLLRIVKTIQQHQAPQESAIGHLIPTSTTTQEPSLTGSRSQFFESTLKRTEQPIGDIAEMTQSGSKQVR